MYAQVLRKMSNYRRYYFGSCFSTLWMRGRSNAGFAGLGSGEMQSRAIRSDEARARKKAKNHERQRARKASSKSWQKQTVHKKQRKQADRASEVNSMECSHGLNWLWPNAESGNCWYLKTRRIERRGVLVSYVNSWRAPRRHNTTRRKLQRAVRPCKPMPRHA